MQHLKRANYQTAIWRRSLQAKPDIPDPVNMGWHIEEGTLEPIWMTSPPAPTAVLQLLSCNCVRSCKEDECQFARSGLKCTELCRLANCANWKSEAVTEADEESSEKDNEYIKQYQVLNKECYIFLIILKCH